MWRWLMYNTWRLFAQLVTELLQYRPGRQTRLSRRPLHIEDLPDDILLYISSFAWDPHLCRSELSLLSHRMRRAFLPVLFKCVQWAPQVRDFPPQHLFPYIQTFHLSSYRNIEFPRPFNHLDIAAQFAARLPSFPSLHTFILGEGVEGGLWTELLQALTASPSLVHLILDGVWGISGETLPEPFDLRVAENPSVPPLQSISFPHPTDGGMDRRSLARLTRESNNLRRILSVAHSTLKSVEIPGEYLFDAVNPGLDWTNLRELIVSGFWPGLASARPRPTRRRAVPPPAVAQASGQIRMMRLLEALPALRRLVLDISALESDVADAETGIIPVTGPTPSHPANFLRFLLDFRLASIARDERILEFLPSGLESLVLDRFPPQTSSRVRQRIPTCSELYSLLERHDFPSLRELNIWYRIDDFDDFQIEQRLLDSVSRKFPLLERLEIHRHWNHASDSAALRDTWDPVPRFRTFLSQLKHLVTFNFDFDHPSKASIHHPHRRVFRRILEGAAQHGCCARPGLPFPAELGAVSQNAGWV